MVPYRQWPSSLELSTDPLHESVVELLVTDHLRNVTLICLLDKIVEPALSVPGRWLLIYDELVAT